MSSTCNSILLPYTTAMWFWYFCNFLQFRLTHNSEWAGGKQYIIEHALFRLWIPWHPFAEQHLITFPFFSFRKLRFSWDDNGWTTTKDQGKHFENIKYRPTNILQWTDYSFFSNFVFNPRIMYTKPQLQVDTWQSLCVFGTEVHWSFEPLELSANITLVWWNISKNILHQTIRNYKHLTISASWFLLTLSKALVECWLYIIDPLIQRTLCYSSNEFQRKGLSTPVLSIESKLLLSPMTISPRINEVLMKS